MLLNSSPNKVLADGRAFADEYGCNFGISTDPRSKGVILSFSDGPSYGRFIFHVDLIFDSVNDSSPSRARAFSINADQIIGGKVNIVPAEITSFEDVESVMRSFLESNGRVSMSDDLERLDSPVSR